MNAAFCRTHDANIGADWAADNILPHLSTGGSRFELCKHFICVAYSSTCAKPRAGPDTRLGRAAAAATAPAPAATAVPPALLAASLASAWLASMAS